MKVLTQRSRYINIDDCWQVMRSPNGSINSDPERFPGGMKALADYIHSKGLKFGVCAYCMSAFVNLFTRNLFLKMQFRLLIRLSNVSPQTQHSTSSLASVVQGAGSMRQLMSSRIVSGVSTISSWVRLTRRN